MTVPNYLAVAFNYLETSGVVDVANTITRMEAQAVALAWTNPGAGHIVSPPNAVGQSIDIQLNRIAATNLEMVFTDSLARTFTRRCQTPATFVERLYFNTFGFAFDPGNAQGLWGTILDLSPELQDCHDQWPLGHGFLTAADANDSTFFTCGSMQLSSANPRVYTPTAQSTIIASGSLDIGVPNGYSQGGSRMWYPCINVGPVTGSIQEIRGRRFQALFVHGNEPAQTEIVVPIDEATTGLFKILSWTPNTGQWNAKIAYRKA
jgi:hypothetical protein